MLDLNFILKATGGRSSTKKLESFEGVSTNSKEDLKNKLFVALKGPRFDGHDFLKEAKNKGALGVMVDSASSLHDDLGITVIETSNNLQALQKLAAAWRQKLNLKVIGITGSNGKTTTKEFLKELLSSQKPYASPKSYNNHIGVPLSILNVTKPSRFLIQEIGTSNPGELAHLIEIADPFVSACVCVGPSHLEGFKNIESVAKEKKQIYTKSKGKFVFNLDDPLTFSMYQELKTQKSAEDILAFSSKDKKSDVYFCPLDFKKDKMKIQARILESNTIELELPFSGRHNLTNVMCASSIALFCGVSSEEILSKLVDLKPPEGRQTWRAFKDMEICFDAYNANPSSMQAFLDQMALSENKPVHLILGDMLELGADAEAYHRALLKHDLFKKISSLWYIGKWGYLFTEELKKHQVPVIWTKKYEKASLAGFCDVLSRDSILGMKASRGLGLEELFFDLTGAQIL